MLGIDHEVDLGRIEAGELKVEPLDRQRLELERQQLLVPRRIERNPVVGEPIGTDLGGRQSSKDDSRHGSETKLERGRITTVAGDDDLLLVNEQRVGPAARADASCDRPNLFLRMHPGVGRIRRDRADQKLDDFKITDTRRQSICLNSFRYFFSGLYGSSLWGLGVGLRSAFRRSALSGRGALAQVITDEHRRVADLDEDGLTIAISQMLDQPVRGLEAAGELRLQN